MHPPQDMDDSTPPGDGHAGRRPGRSHPGDHRGNGNGHHDRDLDHHDDGDDGEGDGGDFDDPFDPDTDFADWDPLEPELHERQVVGLLGWVRRVRMLGRRSTPPPATPADATTHDNLDAVRVLDLGCGNGRALVPLAVAGGCQVVGIDEDPDAIVACRLNLLEAGLPERDVVVVRNREALASRPDDRHHASPSWAARVVLIEGRFADVLQPDGPLTAFGAPRFDLVLCVGYTWMLFDDPLEALRLVRRLQSMVGHRAEDMRPATSGGTAEAPAVVDRSAGAGAPTPPVLLLDDIPAEFWPRLVDGDWISGVSDDGQSQLAWDRADNVFALRSGAAVDPDDDAPQPGETRFRLWTLGELRLLAAAAGVGEPRPDPHHHLLAIPLSPPDHAGA